MRRDIARKTSSCRYFLESALSLKVSVIQVEMDILFGYVNIPDKNILGLEVCIL